MGGTRGACQTSWFRKLEGGAWTAIAGANQASYTANADDIGATLRCKFVPRRADDVTGEAAFAETGPIQINPIVEAAVRYLFFLLLFFYFCFAPPLPFIFVFFDCFLTLRPPPSVV